MNHLLLLLSRWLQFASALLPCGCWLLDRLMAPPLRCQPWSSIIWRRLMSRELAASLAVALVSGGMWLACVTISISGMPAGQALRPAVLSLVWHHTHFGHLWQLRLYLWLALAGASAAALALPNEPIRKVLAWLALLLATAFAGSLAWAGHGITGATPAGRQWHLAADVAHLAIVGIWPLGLLPFVLALRHLRRSVEAEKWRLMAAMTARFSLISIGAVCLLLASGIIDSLMLVGTWHNLFTSDYGRLLMVKILLFAVMVAIGAVNLTRLRTRLQQTAITADEANYAVAARRLQRNVTIEIALAAMVLGIVAVLGIMAPPMH
ncbi:MAG: CopD family protein [Phycisphaerae bacterium]